MSSEWMLRAACRGKPTAWFFPEQHAAHPGVQARAVCVSCPVQAECLADGLSRNEPGIWGNTSVQQRRQIRKHGAAA